MNTLGYIAGLFFVAAATAIIAMGVALILDYAEDKIEVKYGEGASLTFLMCMLGVIAVLGSIFGGRLLP